jgi:rRNA maturation endonuclease Nob1
MIQLSLSNYLALPLLITLLFIGVCSLYYSIQTGRSHHKARKRIYRCHRCAHLYADSRQMPVAVCPRCGEINESVRTDV